MLLLAALAHAADPGSYVLLGRDTSLCPAAADKDCQLVEAPKDKSVPWRDARTWKVLAEQGDWLQVEAIAPGACLTPAPLAPTYTFTAWVKKTAALPALTRSVTIAGDNGTSVVLAAGHAVSGSGSKVQVASDTIFARLAVPADAVGTSFAVTPGATAGDTASLLHNLTFTLGDAAGTGTLWGRDGWHAAGGEAHTTISNTCDALTVDNGQLADALTPPVAATPAAAPAATETVPAGTALSWPSGAVAGTLTVAIPMPEGEDKKGKRCYDAWDGAGTLTLCFAKKK